MMKLGLPFLLSLLGWTVVRFGFGSILTEYLVFEGRTTMSKLFLQSLPILIDAVACLAAGWISGVLTRNNLTHLQFVSILILILLYVIEVPNWTRFQVLTFVLVIPMTYLGMRTNRI